MNSEQNDVLTDDEIQFAMAVTSVDWDSFRDVVDRNPDVVMDLNRKKSKTFSFIESGLCHAAEKNCVKMMEVLHQHGAGVHYYHDRAVQLASREGATDAVRWLLEHGADVENSQCGQHSLKTAVIRGHVEVVKVILDAKRKIVGSEDVASLIKMASSPEVVDLLRPYAEAAGVDVDAKARETTPSVSPPTKGQSAIEYFKGRYAEQGPEVLQQVVPYGIPVAVHTITPKNSDWTFLHTSGMSAHEMNAPSDSAIKRAELFTCLEWNDSIDHMHSPTDSWLFQWMLRLAQYPAQSNEWMGAPITFITPEPQELVAPKRKFTGFVAIPDDTYTDINGETVQVLLVLPVFPEEVAYEKEHGTKKFLELLQKNDVPTYIDELRKNAVTKK